MTVSILGISNETRTRGRPRKFGYSRLRRSGFGIALRAGELLFYGRSLSVWLAGWRLRRLLMNEVRVGEGGW